MRVDEAGEWPVVVDNNEETRASWRSSSDGRERRMAAVSIRPCSLIGAPLQA